MDTNKFHGEPIFIMEEYLSGIDTSDPFFNSFKKKYINFTNWYNYLAASGKKAWIYKKENIIKAFLMTEQDEHISGATGEIPKKERINISKIKITEDVFTIAELFLKIAIKEAVNHEIEELYYTCFPGDFDYLADCYRSFGFTRIAGKTNNENIYIKRIKTGDAATRQINTEEISNKYYPSYYDGNGARKFIIPLPSGEHARLFSDSRDSEPTLFESVGELFIEGNTIRKAIVLEAVNKTFSPGDILLIFNSGNTKAITSVCIVKQVLRQAGEIFRFTENYPLEVVHLGKGTGKPGSGELWLLHFNWHFHLPVYIAEHFLRKNGITGKPLKRILRIDHNSYNLIINKSKLDRSYTTQSAASPLFE